MPLPDRAGAGRISRHAARIACSSRCRLATYLMRAVVREPGGLLGSADRRLDVRDVAGPSVATSDLVLGSANRHAAGARGGLHAGRPERASLEVYGRIARTAVARPHVAVSLAPDIGARSTKTFDAAIDRGRVRPGRSRAARAVHAAALGRRARRLRRPRALVRDGQQDVATVTRQLDDRRGHRAGAVRAAARGSDARRAGHHLQARAGRMGHGAAGAGVARATGLRPVRSAASSRAPRRNCSRRSTRARRAPPPRSCSAGRGRAPAIHARRSALGAPPRPRIRRSYRHISQSPTRICGSSEPRARGPGAARGPARHSPDSVELKTKLNQIERRGNSTRGDSQGDPVLIARPPPLSRPVRRR